MDGNGTKKYGLIIPSKKTPQKPIAPVKSSIFGDEDDSSFPGLPQRNAFTSSLLKKKDTQIQLQKALEENPDVFEYDKVYEQMTTDKQKKEEVSKDRGKADRAPKYISALLASHKERELEFQRRLERKNQREREEEGGQFQDKEAFVTSAYRKKMEELKAAEEREKVMDAIEAKLDVTKQDSLSGFYRHLLKQTTGEAKVRNAGESSSLPATVKTDSKSGTSRRSPSPIQEIVPSKKQKSDPDADVPLDRSVSRSPSRSPSEPKIILQAEQIEDIPEENPAVGNDDRKSPESEKKNVVDLDELARRRAEAKAKELEKKAAVLAKRTTEDKAMSARERYLARQAAKNSSEAK